MIFEHFDSFEALSKRAADEMTAAVRQRLDAHFCLATGASPLGAYREIARRVKGGEVSFWGSHVTKLDEWLGVPMSHSGTCETFLQREVVGPWHIAAERYLAFDADALDPVAECSRIDLELKRLPVFDLCVLGIGPNGHLGLNEPADEIQVAPHIAQLAEATSRHPMLGDTVLERGITLGLGAIMSSRQVLLLVVGESKATAWNQLQSPVVTPHYPASFLHLHPNVLCLSEFPLVGGD